jgi:hypothetical protein
MRHECRSGELLGKVVCYGVGTMQHATPFSAQFVEPTTPLKYKRLLFPQGRRATQKATEALRDAVSGNFNSLRS